MRSSSPLYAPHHYKNGSRCPKCNTSKGEQRIETFLKDNNLSYKTQKTFPNLKYKRKLRFDFSIEQNGIISTLIEFDGEQHFKANNYMGGLQKLRSTQLRDQLKNDYCIKNNIKLIRIKYTEIDSIDKILEFELLNNNIEKTQNNISYYPSKEYSESIELF